MIDSRTAKVGHTVFYQAPHMTTPEYGTISSISPYSWDIVRVLFTFETTPKPCHIRDLYWPPNFISQMENAPPGQQYSDTWPRNW